MRPILGFSVEHQGLGVIARYKFSEAEQAFNNSNYTTVLQNLDEVDKILRKQASFAGAGL